MTTPQGIFLRLMILLCLAPFRVFVAKAENHRVLVVSASGTICPGAQFTKIQDAIDAAGPDDSIHICGGVYPEQLHIDKSLNIDANFDAFLVPQQMLSNATSLTSGDPIAAAIYASNSEDVHISGLTLDGTSSGINSCGPRLMGVYFQNASGVLKWLRIRNFKLGAGLDGCQSGTGVFVQSGGGGKSVVEIQNVFIRDYQKNGITADEVGTSVEIHDNVVTGIGPTSGAAQNGIQVGFGATGTVSKNTVTSNLWSPCQIAATCTALATDILVFGSDHVKVLDNKVGHTQVGIFLNGNNGLVAHNHVFLISVFDGVHVEGNANEVRENKIMDSAESDIFVQGNDNSIERNVLSNAPIGILKTKDSVGNHLDDNKFLDVPIHIQDPPARLLASKIVADR